MGPCGRADAGEGRPVSRRRRHRARRRLRRARVLRRPYLVNFTAARSDDHGTTFHGFPARTATAPASRTRSSTGSGTQPTAIPTNGGNIYLASNEVGRDQPVCGSSNQGNNVLDALPLAAAGGSVARGHPVRAGLHHHDAFMPAVQRGDHGQRRGQPEDAPHLRHPRQRLPRRGRDRALLDRVVPHRSARADVRRPAGRELPRLPHRRATSRSSRSTRPATSTRSGSRRRSTTAATSPATRCSSTATRPTRATTGRRRSRFRRPACTTTSTRGRPPGTTGASTSRGTARRPSRTTPTRSAAVIPTRLRGSRPESRARASVARTPWSTASGACTSRRR